MQVLSKEAREWLAKQCMPEVDEVIAALDSAVAEVATQRKMREEDYNEGVRLRLEANRDARVANADLADAVAALAWWRKTVDPKISSPLIKETDRILNAKGGRT